MKRIFLAIFLFYVCAYAYAEKKPAKSANVLATEALENAYRQNTTEALDAWIAAWPKAPKMLRDKAKTLRSRIGKPDQTKLDSLDEAKWQQAHQRAMESANIYDLAAFGRENGYLFHAAERQQDDAAAAAVNAYKQSKKSAADAADAIRGAAPYYIAYRLLLRELTTDLHNGRFAEAREKALRYQDAFGKDACYTDLLRVLGEAGKAAPEQILPAGIEGQMYDPNITADDHTLYFCGQNLRNSLADNNEDIFVTTRTADGWTAPESVQALNASATQDAVESVSPDGTRLVVFVEGATYVSDKTANGWGKMHLFSDSVASLGDWVGDLRILADGKTAMLTARRMVSNPLDPDLFGATPMAYDMDLYVTQLGADGKWQRPAALPAVINTPFCERAAFLHPDMQTLYFTSNGHSTLGGFDLFRTKRLDPERWTEWSKPENLGHVVNTTGNEQFFSVSTDGKTLYLSSGDNGAERLYALTMPEDMRPEAVATVAGRLLTDAGQPLGAAIRWEDLTSGESLGLAKADPQDGSYFLTLPLGHRYGYFVDEKGYLPVADHLDLREETEAMHIRKDIEVTPLLCSTCDSSVMTVHNLFFATDKADILPESLPELRRLAALVRSNSLHVEISGHADNTGNAKHNLTLSQQRADAVMRFFVEEGCDARMMTAVGYGDKRPVADNNTEEGRQANRRVDLTFRKE